MKTSFIVIAMLFSIQAFATIRTVSNDPLRPAQFSTLTAAHDASSPGDTLYVYGSAYPYPAFSIGKRLVVIGAGYTPNNQFGQPTNIIYIYLYRDSGTNDASGTVITGVITNSIGYQSGSLGCSNVKIFRNRIISGITLYTSTQNYSTGWTIYNNFFESATIDSGVGARTPPSSTNIVIANNIFNGASYIYRFNTNSILVDHNIFLGGSNQIYNVFNAIISNNIFTRTTGTLFATGGVALNTFNNNLSNLSTIGAATHYSPTNIFESTFLNAEGGSNAGAGNFVGVDPGYENAPNLNGYSSTANYRIKSTSPIKGKSTDNSDLGIYGGMYPFPSGGAIGSGYDTSPMPPIPQVTELNIQNATVPANGTLNVKAKANVNN